MTYHFSENFGAVLQAYALQRWFLEQGHQAEFINYHPSHVEDGGEFLSPFRPSNLKVNIKVLYLRLTSLKQRLFGNRAQAAHFKSFRTEVLNVNSQRISRFEDLHSVKPYDLLIAGSDQIWNPSTQKGFDPAYFLAFTSKSVRRISYAASFGRDSLPEKYYQEAKKLLDSIDVISVRERSGLQIINEISGRAACCVPDPTFLHRDYSALVNSSTTSYRGHVFCYALRTAKGIREVANLAAQRLGTKIISPYNIHRRWREIGTTVYPAPSDWLNHVEKSSFVVTNSFHGAAFSIIFQKPFVVVGLPGGKAELNARVKNLLSSLDLMHRFIEAENWVQAETLFNEKIDWDSVSKKQDYLKSSGHEFLLRELNRIV